MLTLLGASGFLGQHIFASLLAGGAEVRACARRPRRALAGHAWTPTDLDDPASLDAALGGADTLIHAAAPYPRYSLDPEPTLRAAERQTQGVLDAAARAGVRRLVFVSSTATVAPTPGRWATEADVYASAPAHGTYHALKWRLEELVRSERRMAVSVVCPAGCLGPGDWRLGTCAPLVAAARGTPLPYADGLVSLVDVRDVGRAVARLVAHPSPPDRLLLSATSMPLSALLAAIAVRYGTPPPPPPLSPEAAIALADRAEAEARRVDGRARLSRELVDLVLHGAPIDASYAETALSMRWTPLSETLDAFDDWARRARVLPSLPRGEP